MPSYFIYNNTHKFPSCQEISSAIKSTTKYVFCMFVFVLQFLNSLLLFPSILYQVWPVSSIFYDIRTILYTNLNICCCFLTCSSYIEIELLIFKNWYLRRVLCKKRGTVNANISWTTSLIRKLLWKEFLLHKHCYCDYDL